MSSDNLVPIQVQRVSKCYQIYDKPEDRLKQALWRGRRQYSREFWALRDVSFDVAKGETLAVIGRNGSGKSTLLQMLCGTLTPSSGTIEVAGRIAALLELGAGFNPEFTGRDNVFLNGALLGISRKSMEQRFAAIEEFADIGDFLDQPVKTYSSGMFVRLAFSVAIHCDPEILVVDEALSVGDFLFQQKCNRYMKENLRNVTKILVTHDLAAVSSLSDRALVLHHGEKVFEGDPQSAIREYQIIARSEERSKVAKAKRLDEGNLRQDEAGVEADRNWIKVPATRLSGALSAKILEFDWEVDGEPKVAAVRDQQKLTIFFRIEASEEINDPIIGYQALDRFGNVIFGENTATSGIELPSIPQGKNSYKIAFDWPLVAPGKYSLTIGLGSGSDALNHTIECWAHNILVLDANGSSPVHGLFNVKLSATRI